MTVNEALAVEVVERLWALGVRSFCLCPGGRNAPLVEALERLPCGRTEVLTFYDERSAAFFALGRARRDRGPAAVLTTSGTAAAELYPAIIEAHYSDDTLIAVTADRPRAYRGTGAPQAIEQAQLFGTYAHQCIDVDRPGETWSIGPVSGPVHLNVCFDEPLQSGGPRVVPRLVALAQPRDGAAGSPALEATVSEWLERVRRPLVILGALAPEDQAQVLEFCTRLGAPVVAEASSHLRCRLGDLALESGEAIARREFDRSGFDGVLRLGDVPSFRIWRDLEGRRQLPVLSVSRKRWSGLTHGIHLSVPARTALPLPAANVSSEWRDPGVEGLFTRDRESARWVDRLLSQYPESEPGIFRRLSRMIPEGSHVYLGNSLPIREWNQFAANEDRGFTIGESRGANGIDGQVSTFLGTVLPGVENWAIVGDLTALYDLSSLWALRHLDGSIIRIVVINNGGGGIFERMYENPRFQNRHSIRLDSWARLWGIDHYPAVPDRWNGPQAVVERAPDPTETRSFWHDLKAGLPA